MFKLTVLLALLSQCLGYSITDGTTLISTVLVHRHGGRTPLESSVFMCSNAKAVSSAANSKYGYGQLTDIGKRRAYELGETIRIRYNELLSWRYNRSEIYIRSTDSTRTKMTVLTAMAAVYPAYPGSWSDEINWVPTPYTTVPAKYDFNMATINCPKFMTAYDTLLTSDSPRMSSHFEVLDIVSEVMDYNITSYPALAFAFYDAYVSQFSLGIPPSLKIACIMSDLEKAANDAIEILYGNPDYIALQAGVMLNEFFTQSDNLIKGKNTPRVRVYSAHDFNVYSMMAAAQVTPRQGVPGYASSFALELRKVQKTGQYVVLPVYQRSPHSEPIALRVLGCDCLPCDYDQFKQIVSRYTLDEGSWRKNCGFTPDLEVDNSDFS